MILAAVAILGGVGLVFAIFIALADRKLKVWEDPRIDAVASMLPNANCGACGVPGCRAFAEKLVAGEMKPDGCNVVAENDDVSRVEMNPVDGLLTNWIAGVVNDQIA